MSGSMSETTALRVAAEGYWLNNSFWGLTQATLLNEVGYHVVWNLWIKGYQLLRNFFYRSWLKETKYDL
jgi:hypothetical protein